MRRLRDVFYIWGQLSERAFCYYGMEFSEFIRFIPQPIDNLLMLKHNFCWGDTYAPYVLDFVEKKSVLEKLLKDDIYNYGDFCFVDYDQHSNLEGLMPNEVASLLYLTHMKSPLDSAFFDTLQNRYAYLAHDDGWFCKLYCRNIYDFGEIIANKITTAVREDKNIETNPFSDELKSRLLQMTEQGLLIDLHEISDCRPDGPDISIDIYQIGKFYNMDDMYNDLEKWKARATFTGWLTYQDQQWKLDM